MTKGIKTSTLIILAVIFLLLVSIGLFWSKIKLLWKPKTSVQSITTTTPDKKPDLNFNLILKEGVYNSEEVRLLQTWLGGLDTDGDFGPLTEEALVERIGTNQTTLASFQMAVAKEADNINNNALGLWSAEDDSAIGVAILNPFTWFNN